MTEIFAPASKTKKWIKVCFWGGAKEGKTECLLGFPKPMAVIDSEKGTLMYGDRFKFDMAEVIRWQGLGAPLDALKNSPGKYQTLGIDSMTPLYQDLISEVAAQERARWGKDIITQFGWGIVKRRFKALITFLLELPMHVVITMRAKDEYENIDNPQGGEEKSRKTGALAMDAEKSSSYLFDFILQCRTEEAGGDKKRGKSPESVKHLVTCLGTRRKEIQKYQSFDITGKSCYETVFEKIAKTLAETGVDSTMKTDVSEISSEAPAPAPIVTSPAVLAEVARATPPPGTVIAAAAPMTPDEKIKDINDTFAVRSTDGNGSRQPQRIPGEPAKTEDLKVLFVEAAKVAWPDGTPLKGNDAKAILKARYGVESTKDLTIKEVDDLLGVLGEVVAKRAVLARSEKGVPFVGVKTDRGIVEFDTVDIPF